MKNGHHCIADRDIFPSFSLYCYRSWLVLESLVGFQVFISIFTFLFIITRGLSTLNRVDLSENLRSRRSRGGSLGLLGKFCY